MSTTISPATTNVVRVTQTKYGTSFDAILGEFGDGPSLKDVNIGVDQENIDAALEDLGVRGVTLEVRPFISRQIPFFGAVAVPFIDVWGQDTTDDFWAIHVEVARPLDDVNYTLWHELGHLQDTVQQSEEHGLSPTEVVRQIVIPKYKGLHPNADTESYKKYRALEPERFADAVADRYVNTRSLVKETR